jgi:hypothetical protein
VSIAGSAVAEVAFIELHGPDRQLIYVNPAEVVSIREPRSVRYFVPGTRCVLVMSNNNLTGVADACIDVRRVLEAGR